MDAHQVQVDEKGEASVARDVEYGVHHISPDKDAAAALVGEHAHAIDPVLEARVVRKIDLFLIPAMLVGYGLVYYDKAGRCKLITTCSVWRLIANCIGQAILGSATLLGLSKDLALSVTDNSTRPPTVDTTRLSWATSIFYFGMLAGLYPMTFALQRFNLGRILGGVVIVWGAICMSTAGVTNFRGLYAQRFFLGFVESIIPTGFMCIISGWYTQKDQAIRQAWWFSGTGWFTIIGSGISYGFGEINSGSLKRWQYLYLLAGSLTIIFGMWCFAVPNSPVSAWFLSPEQRIVAVERLRKGQTGVRCQTIKGSQIREAFFDVKVWLIALMMCSAYTINGAVSGFGPLIVSTFGWTPLDSILLQFPLGGITTIFILVCGYLSAKIPNIRIILLVLCCLPVIAGMAMIWKSTWSYHAAAPVVGYSIIGFFGPVVSLIITVGMANVAGATKKSVMAGTIFVAYCVGNIIGPQLIKSKTKAQHYPTLWTGLIICYCITIASSITLYFILKRENTRRDALQLSEEDRDRHAFDDLTDKQNPYFRYAL